MKKPKYTKRRKKVKPTAEQINLLNQFFNSLEPAQVSKCAICRDTLTHIVTQAEALTGAPTATVTAKLAEVINVTAAPLDKTSGKKLTDKVRSVRGERLKSDNVTNKPESEIIEESRLPSTILATATGKEFHDEVIRLMEEGKTIGEAYHEIAKVTGLTYKQIKDRNCKYKIKSLRVDTVSETNVEPETEPIIHGETDPERIKQNVKELKEDMVRQIAEMCMIQLDRLLTKREMKKALKLIIKYVDTGEM